MRPEDSHALPGMEGADRERAAGRMERESPLFFGTGENPTLFSRARGFVPAPDRRMHFGEGPQDVADVIGRQAGKIRLREGDETLGLKHIELRHGDGIRQRSFADAEEFVDHIAKNYDAIYRNDGRALDLAVTDSNHGKLIVQLERSEVGDYYDVRTATPTRGDQYKNKSPLWERTGTSTPSAEANPLHPRGQSSDPNIARNKAAGAREPQTGTGAKQPQTAEQRWRATRLEFMANAYAQVPRVLRALMNEFGDKLSVYALDNSGEPGEERLIDLQKALKASEGWDYNRTVERMDERLEEHRAKGRFEDKDGRYRYQYAGSDQPGRGGTDAPRAGTANGGTEPGSPAAAAPGKSELASELLGRPAGRDQRPTGQEQQAGAAERQPLNALERWRAKEGLSAVDGGRTGAANQAEPAPHPAGQEADGQSLARNKTMGALEAAESGSLNGTNHAVPAS